MLAAQLSRRVMTFQMSPGGPLRSVPEPGERGAGSVLLLHAEDHCETFSAQAVSPPRAGCLLFWRESSFCFRAKHVFNFILEFSFILCFWASAKNLTHFCTPSTYFNFFLIHFFEIFKKHFLLSTSYPSASPWGQLFIFHVHLAENKMCKKSLCLFYYFI